MVNKLFKFFGKPKRTKLFPRTSSYCINQIALKILRLQSIHCLLGQSLVSALPIFSINVFKRSSSISRVFVISCKLRAKILIEFRKFNDCSLGHLHRLVLDNFLSAIFCRFRYIFNWLYEVSNHFFRYDTN